VYVYSFINTADQQCYQQALHLYSLVAWQEGEERILSLLAVEKGREGGRRVGREGVIQ